MTHDGAGSEAVRFPAMPTPAGGVRAASAAPVRQLERTSPDHTFVLAIDLGTGGPKVALLSASGRIAAHAFAPVGVTLTDDGGAEQSPQAWWEAIVSSARSALAESGVTPDRVVGVGCTSQWSGTVAVDSAGDAIGPAIIWMDSRGAKAVRETVRGALNVQGYSASKLARWIRKTGGIPSLSGKDPVGHIHFLRSRRPDVYASTAVFLEPVDYLNLRLTGLARASHDSITVHWVTDNRDRGAVAYDDALIELAGLERTTLPDLVATGSVLGGLTAAAAEELGLLAGTPVVAGTGDLHSAAVGSGAVADFAAHLYIGTSSWISCHVPFKKTDALTNIASIPSGLPTKYLLADEHETGGACLTWLRDTLLFPDDALSGAGQVEGSGAAGVPDGFFGLLNEVADAVPVGAHGVMFTPWLNGERSPVDDHTIRGGFHNISLSSTRSDMVRAVFEGVALNSAWLLGAVEKFCKRRVDSLAFVGGGANSDLWSQIHADATGRTIRQVADPVLANVRGAGLLTHLALGNMTLDEISGTVAVKATYKPDPAATAVYEERLREFVNLYEKTKAIHKRLNGPRLHDEPS
jgi:xylulokinase